MILGPSLSRCGCDYKDHKTPTNYSLRYYVKKNIKSVKRDSKEVIVNFVNNIDRELINDIINDKYKKMSDDKKIEIINELSDESKQQFIENILIRYKPSDKLYQLVMNLFADTIIEKDNTIISTILDGTFRCFDIAENSWSDCKEEISNDIKSSDMEKFEKIQSNPFGFYLIKKKSGYNLRRVISDDDRIGSNKTTGKSQTGA